MKDGEDRRAGAGGGREVVEAKEDIFSVEDIFISKGEFMHTNKEINEGNTVTAGERGRGYKDEGRRNRL